MMRQSKAKNQEQLLSTVIHKANQEVQEAQTTIEQAAMECAPDAIFSACFVLLATGPAEEITEVTHGDVPAKLEQLAYHLWRCPTPGTKIPTVQCIKQVLTALDKLHKGSLITNLDQEGSPDDSLDSLLFSLSVNARGVRGSAYPEQTSQEIREIAGRFDNWFEANLGAPATDLVDLLWTIGKAEEERLNQWLPDVLQEVSKTANDKNDFFIDRVASGAQRAIPTCKDDCHMPDGTKPSEKLWNILVEVLGLTQAIARNSASPLIARQRPLFVLSNGRVILADISNALDRLWDALETRVRQDQAFYDQRFQRHKSRWLEDKAAKFLARVFSKSNVYRRLSYPDPDKLEQEATTELDLAIRWGPFLVLGEAKAKQFRFEGQLGDVGRLRTDIKANVEDAFEESRRAWRYLMSVEEAVFEEQGTGRELRVRSTDLQRIYLLTVSLHHLATTATQLTSLQSLGLFRDKDYPWAICLADLDIISQFTKGPDVFLHYIERRLEVQRSDIAFHADELDFFGAYLQTRLHSDRFSLEGRPNFVSLIGFSTQFDEWIQYQRGDRTEAPIIQLEIPGAIHEVLAELRTRPGDDSKWIAFALLDLSDEQLEAIAQLLSDAREQEPPQGRFRSAAITLGDTVFSITITVNLLPDELEKRTAYRVLAEKYWRKVPRAIGFGIHLRESERPFHCCIWADFPWEPDPKMEALKNDQTHNSTTNRRLANNSSRESR